MDMMVFKSSLAFRKSRPRPSSAAARPGLTAPRSASMGMQASAPGELRGAMGRLDYLSLSVGGPTANFVVDAQAVAVSWDPHESHRPAAA